MVCLKVTDYFDTALPFYKNDVTLQSRIFTQYLTVKQKESCQSIWWKTHARLLRTDLLK